MKAQVGYEQGAGFAVIRVDDGKVNAMSNALMGEIDQALDRAEADGAVVVLTGRDGVFSAGFDLSVFEQGHEPTMEMLRTGAALNRRILSFPTPVIIACNGHGIAMGSFLLMCADYRIGAEGRFKIGMNEVAIGMTLPYFAIEIARRHLSPTHFDRATVLAELYSPAEAIVPGFLDRVVPPDALESTAHAVAETLAKLDMRAHAASKLRARRATLNAIDQMVDAQFNS